MLSRTVKDRLRGLKVVLQVLPSSFWLLSCYCLEMDYWGGSFLVDSESGCVLVWQWRKMHIGSHVN